MKKMDEMDRNIQLHSEELGYKAAVLALCAWILFGCFQSLMYDVEYTPIPTFILCLAISIQQFARLSMKQKMISGDEEYHEPNRFLQAVILTVVFVVILLSIGTFLALAS